MIASIRDHYNNSFTQSRYEGLLRDLYGQFNHVPGFRIAETPVFIPAWLKNKIFDACHQISDVIMRDDFHTLSAPSLAKEHTVPNEDAHTTFLQMDFGL